tara:strand:- start:30 stop:578 length:549 start_codon:yes stop_codon:yes gene_type:complete
MRYIFLLFVFIIPSADASVKENILLSLKNIQNLNFNFTQTINGKDETGNCTILYPKKIYCKYNLRNNKELVSNGKSLVIKSDKNKQYYRYPLDDTPLVYILDKKFIIDKIENQKEKLIDEKFYLFEIVENNQKINIFFEKENLKLIGWQTEDLYQNLTVTFIYDLKINYEVDKKIFKLPLMY